MECLECSAPLKANASHCLECGSPVVLGPPAPPTVNAAFLPPLPNYAQPQPAPNRQPFGGVTAPAPLLLGTANAPIGYEPPLLQQWMSQWRTNSHPAAPLDVGGLLVRLVYFLFVGIWASQLWIVFAWLISITIIGLPLGLAMVRVLPQVAFLSPRRIRTNERAYTNAPQTPFGLRAIYFLLIGWWVSFIWMQLAWVAGITIIGLPLALGMFALTPTIATLARP